MFSSQTDIDLTSHFDIHVGVIADQKYVLGLEVAMSHIFRMQIGYRTQKLQNNNTRLMICASQITQQKSKNTSILVAMKLYNCQRAKRFHLILVVSLLRHHPLKQVSTYPQTHKTSHHFDFLETHSDSLNI